LFSEKLLGIAIETIGAANVSLSHLGARDPRDLIRQSESRFPDSKKLHVDKTALGSAVELAYATSGNFLWRRPIQRSQRLAVTFIRS